MLKTKRVVLFHVALTKKNSMYNFTPNTKDTVNVIKICSYLVTITITAAEADKLQR